MQPLGQGHGALLGELHEDLALRRQFNARAVALHQPDTQNFLQVLEAFRNCRLGQVQLLSRNFQPLCPGNGHESLQMAKFDPAVHLHAIFDKYNAEYVILHSVIETKYF